MSEPVLLALPPETRERLQRELSDDERVLWSAIDQPGASRSGTSPAAWRILSLSVVPAAVFLVLGWLVWSATAAGAVLAGAGVLCLLLPVAVVRSLVVSRRRRTPEQARSLAITDHRVVVLDPDMDPPVMSIPAREITGYASRAGVGDCGDLAVVFRNAEGEENEIQLAGARDCRAGVGLLKRIAPAAEPM
jgi:hypothetical protein